MSRLKEVRKEYLKTIKTLKEEMLKNPRWVKDWRIGIRNFFSKTSYSVFNQLNLSMLMAIRGEHKEPYFATFKQIKEAGAKIKKGSKGYPIYFYKPYEIKKEEEIEREDENGNIIEVIEVKKTIPLLKKYVIFNIEDVEGIEIPSEQKLEISKRQIFEKINNEVTITYGNPAWVVGESKILMPKVADFKNQDAFIAALFHEFSHYTHWKIGLMDLSKDNYAFDEVVAETSAAILCNIFNIDYPVDRHAGYLVSWGKKLDDREFEKALKEAGKVVEAVLEKIKKEIG